VIASRPGDTVVHGEKGGLNFLYTAREILNRLNEFSFNSSLMR
jgi:hypothetical protein